MNNLHILSDVESRVLCDISFLAEDEFDTNFSFSYLRENTKHSHLTDEQFITLAEKVWCDETLNEDEPFFGKVNGNDVSLTEETYQKVKALLW